MPVGKASVSLASNGTTLLNLMSAHPTLQNSAGRAETVKRRKKVSQKCSQLCAVLCFMEYVYHSFHLSVLAAQLSLLLS